MSRGRWARAGGLVVVIVLLVLVPLFIKNAYWLHVFIMAAMAVILACSLRVIANAGLISMGHGGMMAVGAYTSALLVTKLGFSSWASLLVSGLAAALLALIVGFPFMRIRGIYFSLVTVFLAEVVRLAIEQWRSVTGGTMGLTGIPKPDKIVIPHVLTADFSSKMQFYYLALILVAFSLGLLYALERSKFNQIFAGIEQADFLADSVGISSARFKVLAFCIGCFFAGLVGGFYSQYMSTITPSTFGFVYSVYVLIYVIVGGRKRFIGPIIGAIIFTFIPEIARPLKEYQPFIFAGLLMLTIFFLREGVVSLPGRVVKLVRGGDHA
jgi:branched-chain amino acid transport system permease protein